MTRYEWLKSLSVEELAWELLGNGSLMDELEIDDYCKRECERGCPHPEKCCAEWLLEEVEVNNGTNCNNGTR